MYINIYQHFNSLNLQLFCILYLKTYRQVVSNSDYSAKGKATTKPMVVTSRAYTSDAEYQGTTTETPTTLQQSLQNRNTDINALLKESHPPFNHKVLEPISRSGLPDPSGPSSTSGAGVNNGVNSGVGSSGTNTNKFQASNALTNNYKSSVNNNNIAIPQNAYTANNNNNNANNKHKDTQEALNRLKTLNSGLNPLLTNSLEGGYSQGQGLRSLQGTGLRNINQVFPKK